MGATFVVLGVCGPQWRAAYKCMGSFYTNHLPWANHLFCLRPVGVDQQFLIIMFYGQSRGSWSVSGWSQTILDNSLNGPPSEDSNMCLPYNVVQDNWHM